MESSGCEIDCENGRDKDSPAGAIAGGVVGSVLGLAAIATIFLLVLKRRKTETMSTTKPSIDVNTAAETGHTESTISGNSAVPKSSHSHAPNTSGIEVPMSRNPDISESGKFPKPISETLPPSPSTRVKSQMSRTLPYNTYPESAETPPLPAFAPRFKDQVGLIDVQYVEPIMAEAVPVGGSANARHNVPQDP
jgi:hypothetical protein